MNSAGKGQIITFYSYKGGTGRTMAVANVAWILASSGKRVLMVDWDLDAPGLHRFFHPFLDEPMISATPGVVEIINDYALAAQQLGPSPEEWYLDHGQVLQHAVSLKWKEFPAGACLDFLSSGRQNRDYSTALFSLDWDNFYHRLHGGEFFQAMREDMKKSYDYVLIDSRTGLSDVADICTIELPDTLVVCYTLNDQSMDGGASIARQINGRYRDRNIRVLPVAMRIENAEKEKLDAGRALARAKFEGFPPGLNKERYAQYWATVEVPYLPFYAFEETLATFGDQPGLTNSLLAAFERLTSAITAGEVSAMPPMADEVRLPWRDMFIRRPPAQSAPVLLSYVPEDRIWAEWIEFVLKQAGLRVMLRSAVSVAASPDSDETGQAVGSASHAIAILSKAYVTEPEARAQWDAMTAVGPSRRLVAVKVSEVRLTEPFDTGDVIDLVQLDQDQATRALLEELGAPAQLPPRQVIDGEPRFPSAVPDIWNMPPRNADFTGRGAGLEQLRDNLMEGGRAVVVAQALYGLGGVGKTQMALEYAYRFMADYDLAWWVPAERTDQIVSSLAELAGRLGISVSENVTEAANAVVESLRRGRSSARWLLIFDNAEDPKELESFLPAGGGHVLITSRNQTWSHLAEPLEIDVFQRRESITHLMLHVPHLAEADADRVAAALGDLPLAIEQAGAWLEQTGMQAEEYLEQLRTQAPRVLAMGEVANYPQSVITAWNMSIDRLQGRSPAAARLLQLCAFFSPGPISMILLYSDEMINALLPYDDSLTEKLILGRVIREISRLALIKVDQGNNSIQIHRLVQAVIRSQMTEEEQEAASHEIHEILVGARPRRGETDDPVNWERYDIIWPHLEPSRADECTQENTRQLLLDRVRFLWKRGEYDAGLELARKLETRWEQQLGPDHRQTLYLRFHIANLLRSQGKFHEARDIDAHVLAKQREVLPADHPHTLMTAGSLAADLRALGEFQQALERDQETYERFKDQFGTDHSRTLAAANNLAVSLRLVGDCFKAREIDQETLNLRRRVLGRDHPDSLCSEANLARDIREAGLFSESVNMLQQTLGNYRRVLGDDLPDTLRTAKSLAVSLRKCGEQREALRLTEETYERYRARYGKEEPDVLACALNLACDYSALNNKPKARQLVEDVRKAYRQILGPTHPYTLVAANNLVTYLRGTGAVEEGFTLARATLAEMTVSLGEDHPFTLSCAINLANCLGDLSELTEAEDMELRTLLRLNQRLGAEHPDTLVCEANLAVTLHLAGRNDEASEIRHRVQAEMDRVLGKDHPNGILLREWERNNRDLEPQPT
jgi:TIR domain/Tetratricopeptide repeat/CobQ/CobB/MinD/ParA nucleotide binding domain/NB-ARC domain